MTWREKYKIVIVIITDVTEKYSNIDHQKSITLKKYKNYKPTCVKSCELQSSTRTSRAKSPLSFPPGELEFRQTLIDETIGFNSLELKLKTIQDKHE